MYDLSKLNYQDLAVALLAIGMATLFLKGTIRTFTDLAKQLEQLRRTPIPVTLKKPLPPEGHSAQTFDR
jgi:hypothetical protein